MSDEFTHVTVPEYIVACEKALTVEVDEFNALAWDRLIPPQGWQKFPQAVRLSHACSDRFSSVLHDYYMGEEAIMSEEQYFRSRTDWY